MGTSLAGHTHVMVMACINGYDSPMKPDLTLSDLHQSVVKGWISLHSSSPVLILCTYITHHSQCRHQRQPAQEMEGALMGQG